MLAFDLKGHGGLHFFHSTGLDFFHRILWRYDEIALASIHIQNLNFFMQKYLTQKCNFDPKNTILTSLVLLIVLYYKIFSSFH